MKRGKNFFKLVEKLVGSVFWNETLLRPEGGKIFKIMKTEYKKTSEIQEVFGDTTFTTSSLNNTDNLTLYNILKSLNFYSTEPKKGGQSKSARLRDITDDLPETIEKRLSPPLTKPAIEIDDGDNPLQGEGMKIMISFNIIDIWTRL